VRLNLGCGRTILDGWVNLDIVEGPGVDIVADLDDVAANPLPLADDSVDEIVALHLIEHLRNPLEFMAEMWRVAKPGASFALATPYGSSDDAWEDMTHTRPYFVGSWQAFGQPYYHRADYGYRADWQPVEITVRVPRARYEGCEPADIFHDVQHARNVVDEMCVTLEAVKPARSQLAELGHQPQAGIALV
jgi:SAM-dependent methyltransferase